MSPADGYEKYMCGTGQWACPQYLHESFPLFITAMYYSTRRVLSRYLGQLLEGADSISSFERGIKLLREALQGAVSFEPCNFFLPVSC